MDQKKTGSYIAEKRKALALTQAALAEKLGVSDKSVSKWERGICLPDVSKYQELCDILGISLNELFAGEDIEIENIISQSEQNLIGVEEHNKIRRKRFKGIIALLMIIVFCLSSVCLWMLKKDDYFKENYIKPYSIGHEKEAALIWSYGDASLYTYSLNTVPDTLAVNIVKYVCGKEQECAEAIMEFPEGLETQKGVIGIKPVLEQKLFEISADGVYSVTIPVEVSDSEADWGWSYSDISGIEDMKTGENRCIYAYLSDNGTLRQTPLAEIMNNPGKALKNTDLCFLVYVTFY